MKVFLRVPTNAGVDRGVVDWLAYISREIPNADIATHYTSCFGIAEGRNGIVQDFLKSDCTHLWMVDSDTIPAFSTGILEHDKPIVCGPYMGWRSDVGIIWHVYVHLKQDEKGQHRYASVPRAKWPKERLFKADAAGTGCMLIQREVLEQSPRGNRPFYHVLNHDGSLGTEDISFCRNHGGVWIDAHYTCEHMRDVPLYEANRRLTNTR